jgi:hyperosmotically inducible protein
MQTAPFRPLAAVAASVVIAGSLLAGCQQRTTTVTTPDGSRTTTTVTPNPAARNAAARAGDAVGDAAITAKVKSALMADPDVKALQIDVDTQGGVVTLNGKVDRRTNVDKAMQIAQGVDGVRSVENHLTAQ